jgi:hypothetical protein
MDIDAGKAVGCVSRTARLWAPRESRVFAHSALRDNHKGTRYKSACRNVELQTPTYTAQDRDTTDRQ